MKGNYTPFILALFCSEVFATAKVKLCHTQ